jgi:hypothetical protein
MNQTQRKFLIERIQKGVKSQIQNLKDSKLKYPSASNYLFKAIMGDKLELQPKEVILSALKQKALNSKEGENWLSEKSMGWDKQRTILMQISELVIIPNDFDIEMRRVENYNSKIDKEINLLYLQLDSIEVRIQLASDSRLARLVNDVDDMGDIRLVDATLKIGK